MYRFSYAEVLSDSPSDARAAERRALDQAVTLLEQAENTPHQSLEEQMALEFTTQAWALFIKDLARPDNDLDPQLRADLMSIGLGVMSESQRIAAGQSRDFLALAEICGIIRDGLA